MMHSHHSFVTTTRRLEEEVQIRCNEVSFKFVIEPSIEEVKSDALIYLKQFSTSIRSKYHVIERAKPNKATNPGGKNSSDDLYGLGTGLPPINGLTPCNKPSKSGEAKAFSTILSANSSIA